MPLQQRSPAPWQHQTDEWMITTGRFRNIHLSHFSDVTCLRGCEVNCSCMLFSCQVTCRSVWAGLPKASHRQDGLGLGFHCSPSFPVTPIQALESCNSTDPLRFTSCESSGGSTDLRARSASSPLDGWGAPVCPQDRGLHTSLPPETCLQGLGWDT